MASTSALRTDYLVVGAGISGLSFADELLTNTTASITIVDKRDVPGGHWNDSYSFVKLHQPSHCYGVNSKDLGSYRIDEQGPNKGFLTLASGPEVISYCHAVMNDRLLPSGRVTYLPLTTYQPDGTLLNLLSGKRTTVTVLKKLVDATYYTNSIPLNHVRSFRVESPVTCVPPNFLPNLAKDYKRYTILGGGKTAMDSCLWLLSNGAEPSQLRWIIPRDYWYFNRAKFQPGEEFFNEVFGSFGDRLNVIANAKNAKEYALGMENAKIWMRLDPNIYPSQFHAATLSEGEIEDLRKIQDVVRKGHVTNISANQITLTAGSVTSLPNTLYIDCTASAISHKPLVPVFQPGKIVLQFIRFPLVAFSCAAIAFLESLDMDDEERNAFTSPVGFDKTVEDHVQYLPADLWNTVRLTQHPRTSKWLKRSRLDGFSPLAAAVKPHETEKIATLTRMRKAMVKAVANVDDLAASVKQRPRL